MGRIRNAYKLLVRQPEWKRPLVRPRRRWEDNIRMDLGKTWWEVLDWIHLAQDREQWRALLDIVLYLPVP